MSNGKPDHADGQPARVILIEDDQDIVGVFTRRLQNDARFKVVADTDSVRRGRTLLRAHQPDLLLLDLELTDGHGSELIAGAVQQNIVVVVVSVYEDRDAVLNSLSLGAAGYLLKSTPAPAMLDLLEAALRGEAPLSPAIAGHLLQRLRAPAAQPSPLTSREQQVLEQLARGSTYREAARILEISVNTVAFHLKQTYAKLEVRSRSEAVYQAVQQGLIDFDDASADDSRAPEPGGQSHAIRD